MARSPGEPSPSTSLTGSENVSRIGDAGPSGADGLGWTTATGIREVGNQLTRTGAPSRSQARAAAATSTVPVEERRGSATEL